MAITRDQFVTGLVWRWSDQPNVATFLVLEPARLHSRPTPDVGWFKVFWTHEGLGPRETPGWRPEAHQLKRMEPAPHTPETLIRWIRHLKETTDAQTTA